MIKQKKAKTKTQKKIIKAKFEPLSDKTDKQIITNRILNIFTDFELVNVLIEQVEQKIKYAETNIQYAKEDLEYWSREGGSQSNLFVKNCKQDLKQELQSKKLAQQVLNNLKKLTIDLEKIKGY